MALQNGAAPNSFSQTYPLLQSPLDSHDCMQNVESSSKRIQTDSPGHPLTSQGERVQYPPGCRGSQVNCGPVPVLLMQSRLSVHSSPTCAAQAVIRSRDNNGSSTLMTTYRTCFATTGQGFVVQESRLARFRPIGMPLGCRPFWDRRQPSDCFAGFFCVVERARA